MPLPSVPTFGLWASALALVFAVGCTPDKLGQGDGGAGSGGATNTLPSTDETTTSGSSTEHVNVDNTAPLGAHLDENGNLQLAVRSFRAERVEVWFYAAPQGEKEVLKVLLDPKDEGFFRGAVSAQMLDEKGLADVAYYGLRVWGPGFRWDPEWTPGSLVGFEADVDAEGNRFNPNKLLLDPYAIETSHDPKTPENEGWAVYTTGPDHRTEDTGPKAPKGILFPKVNVDPGPAQTRPLGDHIIYEVHVRGFTKTDESLPADLRGTYAGAAAKADYLADLGVTAIELLPIHETQNEQNDIDPTSSSGDNYWGYSTLSFFAPERRYALDKSPGGPTREFRAMVKAFHEANIAVILDVVYNHTAEGGTWDKDALVAPLLSLRGLDNVGYYQLGKDAAHYQNDNGVGPNIAAKSTLARNLVLDSLRYYREEMGVDGFRFDLAPILANGCEKGCFKFDAEDPSGIVKRAVTELDGAILIAEPWGTGAGTYQAGNFPKGWSEWNDHYRDRIRDDQNRDGIVNVTPGWLADTFSGSWSLFGEAGRGPTSSINYLVAHDGLTLRDLYSCNGKNNSQPWPYGPSDGGTDDNRSWDQGGDKTAQRQAARTGLALLMVSAGVPMITGGDEMWRTQKCNNNPYNLDSVGSWLDNENLVTFAPFYQFARKLMRFRSAHPALRPAEYRPLSDGDGNGLEAIRFLRDNGAKADAAYLDNPGNDFLAFRVDGEEAGDSVRSIFVAYNGWKDGINATLPAPAAGNGWYLISDTHSWLEGENNFYDEAAAPLYTDSTYLLGKRSVLILVERATQ